MFRALTIFMMTIPLTLSSLAAAEELSALDDFNPPQKIARQAQSNLSAAALQAKTIAPVKSKEEAGGLLRFRGEGGEWQAAPSLSLHYDVTVAGLIARLTVTQSFYNPTNKIIEAQYSYPLPAESAVDGLKVKIGTREIQGEIKEKQAARKAYEQAKKSGKRAALLEQARLNVFSTAVSHIEPGQTVEVQIELQKEVDYRAGVFSLTLPSTLTPRYTPGLKQRADNEESGPAQQLSALSAEGFLAAPVALQSEEPQLSFDIKLAQGFELQSVSSSSHALLYQQGEEFDQITPQSQSLLADRDVHLSWAPELKSAPSAALFYDEVEGQKYALVMILPAAPEQSEALAREVTFVIDESGSMLGDSMAQAKLALLAGLNGLQQKDSFNIIAFDDEQRPLYDRPQVADAQHLEEGREFAQGIAADGGTEMYPALRTAFRPENDLSRVGQVIFVTDGAIGNETSLIQLIHQELDERRLFPVSIGSAPNSGFMREAARFGRGSFTSISRLKDVKEKMGILTEQLRSPVLTGLQIEGEQLDVYPRRLPDLYAGEPLVFSAKVPDSTKKLSIKGRRAGKDWSFELPLTGGAALAGVQKAYGRRVVESLLDKRGQGLPEVKVREQVVPVALELGLVTPYTSLVAIENTAHLEGPADEQHRIASAAPHGSALFGNMPATATPMPLYLLASLLSMLGAFVVQRRKAAA